MENKLLGKLRAGEKTVGTFFGMGNATVAECLGLSGIDYFIIDTEHGPFDVESAMEIMRGGELGGTTCLVRVKDGTRTSVLKMLDIGARGLIIPNVHSVADVEQIIDYAKYYPQGNRGVAQARGAGYGCSEDARLPLEDYFAACNEGTMLIPQCETRGCLEQIDDVCALDGVAGIFIGPFDLSCALGKPGQFQTEEFKSALERVRKACREHGKFCFVFATSAEAARGYFRQGFDSVTIGMDYNIYIDAFRKLTEDAKA